MPIVKTTPAMPGNVSAAPTIAMNAIRMSKFRISATTALTPLRR